MNKGDDRYIQLEAINLSGGMTKRVVCPSCNGGATNERSLAISRMADGNLIYYCFRDSCHASGVVGSKGSCSKPVEKGKFNPYTSPTESMGEDAKEYMRSRFRLTDEEMYGWKQSIAGHLLIPLKGADGLRWGLLDRNYSGLTGVSRSPKAINYSDGPNYRKLHFPKVVGKESQLVLVEDVISAIRVARMFPCVALLGTHLTDSDAVFLRDLGVEDIVFFLDSDANGTSMKERSRHSTIFNSVRSVIQYKGSPDPKDMDDLDIKELIWSV